MAKSTRSPLEQFMAQSIKMAKRRDADKGLTFDENITIDFLVGLYRGQQGLCYWTGEEMTLERGLVDKNEDGTGGVPCFTLCTIDRKDNTRGYSTDNILMACDGINRMRGNMSMAKFRALCKRIGMSA